MVRGQGGVPIGNEVTADNGNVGTRNKKAVWYT